MAFDPFPHLSSSQQELLSRYEEQLFRFNQRVNLISPETEGAFRTRHLLHCLTLTVRGFPDSSTIVDWGTGGGLPAIPLAICEPEVTVVGVDSVGKKSRAVRTIARRLGLENCFTWNGRAEEWTGDAHYSVSRATAPLAALWQWHRRVAVSLEEPTGDDEWPTGLLALKGGDLSDEIAALRDADSGAELEQTSLEALLGRNGFFEEKKIVAVRSR